MIVISPKKLIEVALPLDVINAECTRRKRKAPAGYPTAFHKWWAQRPVAAARAVTFAQLVHDPEDLWRCKNPGKMPNNQERGHWTKARAKLFAIIEDLVKWENSTNEIILEKAREAIRQSWRESCDLNKDHPQAKDLFNPAKLPALLDPFAGGGTIPLEAQRLGLEAIASDLNPVAVMINKAMIELPPKFWGRPPVHPKAKNELSIWEGTAGMAEDVCRYSQVIRDEAFSRIGEKYPPVVITKMMAEDRPDLEPFVGKKLKVAAWIWTRTVRSPNPAFSHVDVPLASTFVLNSRPGKQAYIDPIINKSGYTLTVKTGKPSADSTKGTSAGKRKAFRCIMSNVPIAYDYIRKEGKAGRLGMKLMAIVAEGTRGRIYLSAIPAHEEVALGINATSIDHRADLPIARDPWPMTCLLYGMERFDQLFMPRQLLALTTFRDLIIEAQDRIRKDALAAGLTDDDKPLDKGGTGALAYAQAISVYLWCILARVVHYSSTVCAWLPKDSAIARTFTKQAIPITWDFAEGSVFGKCSTEWNQCCHVVSSCLNFFSGKTKSYAHQGDAASLRLQAMPFISTDPPYYDNVGYSDLSDFFYVWMRPILQSTFPQLLATVATPKAEELVAALYRHGSEEKAEAFFLNGMRQAMHALAIQAHPAAPITIYYAFKQSETEKEGTNSTGWETFLEAVLNAGLVVTGTWPMRTEGDNRMRGLDSNALASSIILVCRPRAKDAGTIGRRKFISLINEALPLALDAMTRESEGIHSPVAPVDLSQAIVGPGMAIFSRYDAVLEADGTPMAVKTALQLINRFLAEDDFDADTQFCLHWFEHHGWDAGKFGEADTLARAKEPA